VILVLLGPPGSGKTHLGERLCATLGLSFEDEEAAWVRRYGSRQTFLGSKPDALAEREQQIRARVESSTAPLVIESTGVSDQPVLESLARDFRVLLVKVIAARDTCVERVGSRPRGRHLNNAPDDAGRFHDFWMREIEPRYAFDLELATDARAESDLVQAVRSLVDAAARGESARAAD